MDLPGASDTPQFVLIDAGGNWTAIFHDVSPDGWHTITARVEDECGLPDIDSVNIYVDTTLPEVLITSPVDGNTECSSTVVVVGTATDFGGSGIFLGGVTVDLPGASDTPQFVSVDAGGDWTATFHDVVPDGWHTITARVEDECGRTGTDLINILVDTTPPTVDVDPLADCYTVGSVTVSATCGDVGSGVAACEVSIDDGANWFPSPHLYIGLLDDNYTAIGRATDNCGNTASDLVGETFAVDTVAVVSITYPVAGETIVAGDVTVTGTADTDITTVTVTTDQGHSESSVVDPGGNWSVVLLGVTVPSITINAQGMDNCGNIGNDSVTVPVVPPVCLILSVGPTTGCPGDLVTITGTTFGAIAGSVIFDPGSVTATITFWSDTSIIVEAPGGDYSTVTVAPLTGGLCSLPGTYFYDDVPPAILITSPVDGNTECSSTVVVVGTATDFGGSGIFLGGVTVDLPGASDTPQFVLIDAGGNWTAIFHDVSPDGWHTITARVEDECGLPDIDSVNIYVDTTLPEVLITSPVDGNTECSSTVVVVGTATDFGGSGIFLGGVTVDLPGASDTPQFVSVDAGGDWTATFHDVVPDGWHTITARVEDECGRTGTDLINILVDTTPPTVDVDPLADCYTVGSVTVSATCGDVGSGVYTCSVSIDDGANWFGSPHVYIGLITGGYTAIGRATDNCGNTASDMVGEPFAVDMDAPTVDVDPLAGCYTTGSVTVSATCGDVGSGVATCEVSIDGGANWFSSPYVYISLTTGPYTAIGRVSDVCGNTGSDPVGEPFEVDVDAPTVDVDPLADCYTVGSVTVSATCGDVGSGLATCEVSVDGGLAWFISPHVYIGLTTGDYRTIGRATDNCGNTASDMVGEEFAVDVDLPTVDVDPLACQTTGSVTVSVTCADVGSGVATCEVSINGVTWYDSPHIYIGLTTGGYTAVGRATDNCGNTASDLVGEPFEVDVDLPTVDVDPMPDCDLDGDVTVSAICGDVGSGLATCEVSIDDGANWFPSPNLYLGLADGNYTAIGRATDNCGNTASDLVGEPFEVDTVAVVTITYPVAGVTIPAGDVTVTGTADDDITIVTVTSDQGHSGPSTVVGGNWSIVLTGVTVPSIVITATGTDNCDNIGSDSVTVPVEPPVCLIISVGPTTGCPGALVTITGTNFGPNTGTVTFNGTTATVTSWTNTFITVEAPGGIYGNVIVAPLTGGLCSLPGNYFYDNQAPTVDVDPLACQTTGSVTVSATCADVGSGVYTCSVSIDGGANWFGSPHTYTGLTPGPYTAIGWVTDNCGNTASDLVGEAFAVDVDLPTVDVDPLACQPGGLVTVSATCGDVGSGVAACEVSIDGGANWFASPHLYIGLAEGPYTAIGQVSDVCGNAASDLVGEPFAVDSIPPVVSITEPADGQTYCSSTIVVVGTATDFGGSGILWGEVTVELPGASDAPQFVLVDAGGNWTATFHNVPDGVNTITALVEDECGWTDTYLVNILVDTTPPVVSIAYLEIGLLVKVGGTATDSGGFGIFQDGVTVFLPGASDTPQFVLLDAGGNWSATFHDTTPGGPYTITAWVEDECGRTGTDRIKFIPPPGVVTITSPTEGICINTMPVTVTGTFGGFSGVAVVDVFVNGVTAVVAPPASTTSGSYTAILTSAELPEGLNQTITAVASDGASTAIASITVNVDLTPPVVTIDSPTDGECINSSVVVVRGTASDSGSGLAATITVDLPGSNEGTVIAPVGVGGSWSATFTIPATGPYTATASLQDLCGNTGSESVGFNVDLWLPTATVTAPTINECISAPTVAVTAQCDDDVGVASCEVTVDGGAWMPSGTVFNLADGPHTAQARAADTCGNTGVSILVPFLVDTTPPITMAAPTGGAGPFTSIVTVVLTATDNYDPSPDIWFDMNETGIFNPYAVPILISITTTLDFYAVDNCGNVSPIMREVYTFTGCMVGITTPVPGECINTMPATVTGSFDGFVGVGAVDVFVNGVTALVAPPGATTSGSYTATIVLPEGLGQTITAVASDGTCTATAIVVVNVDLIPPMVAITLPVDGSTVCTSQVVVEGSCSDVGSGLAVVNGCVLDVGGLTADLSGGSATFSLADGYYTATLTATDTCGISSSTRVSFWVDTVPPIIAILTPTLPPLVYDNRGTDIWGTIWDPSFCGPGAISYLSPTTGMMFGEDPGEIGVGHVVRSQTGQTVVVPININASGIGPTSTFSYEIWVDFDDGALALSGPNSGVSGPDPGVPSPWTGTTPFDGPLGHWEPLVDFGLGGPGALKIGASYIAPDLVDGTENLVNICFDVLGGVGTYDIQLYVIPDEGGFIKADGVERTFTALAGSITVYTPTAGRILVYDGDDVSGDAGLQILVTVTTDAVDGQTVSIPVGGIPYTAPVAGGQATLTVNSFANGANTLIARVSDEFCPDNIGYSAPFFVDYVAGLLVAITDPAPGQLFTEVDDVDLGVGGIQINVTVTSEATDGSAVTITANGSTDTGTITGGSFTGTVTLSEGMNLIEAVVVDPVQGTGTGSVAVELDALPPLIAFVLINDDDTYTNDPYVTVTISATDPGSTGVQLMQVACDGFVDVEPLEPYASPYPCTLIPATDGTRTVEVVVWDGANHSSAPGSDDIILDTAGPTVNITSPACPDTLNTSTVVVSADCTDATSGVGSCEVNLDGGAWDPPGTSYTGVADGPHTAYARATDLAGNSTIQTPCDFIVFTGVISVTFTNPVPSQIIASTSVACDGDYTSALNDPTIDVNGTPMSDTGTTPNGTWSGVVAGLAQGNNTLTVTADDTVNTDTAVRTVCVDTVDPTVAINPLACQTSTTVVVTGTANDAGPNCGGIAQVLVNPGAVVADISALPAWTATLTLIEGANTVDATATDAAGNPSAPDSIVVDVDTIDPAVTITQPGAGSTITTADTVVVKFTAVDASGLDNASGTVTLVPYGTTPATFSAGVFTATFLAVANGSYTATACVDDLCGAGNTGCSTVDFAVDFGVAFAMSIESPTDGALVVTMNSLTRGSVITYIPISITWINGVPPYDASGLQILVDGVAQTVYFNPNEVSQYAVTVTSNTTASGYILSPPILDETVGGDGLLANVTITAEGVVDAVLSTGIPDVATIDAQLGHYGGVDKTAVQGGSVSVPVYVYIDPVNTPGIEGLMGYDVNIDYDNTVLTYTSCVAPVAPFDVMFDASPTFFDAPTCPIPGPGAIRSFEATGLDPYSPDGYFGVVIFNFNVIGAAGDSTVLDIRLWNNDPNLDFLDRGGLGLPASRDVDSTVKVIAQPPPVVSGSNPASSAGGFAFGVFIFGEWFMPGMVAADVSIAGVNPMAPPVFDSPEQISALNFVGLPSDGGWYDIVVCNPDAQCGICVGCFQCN